MSVTYCSECGKKHDYNFAKPNFCSSCGESFGSVRSKSVNKHSSTQNNDDEEEDFDEDDDDGSFTNASYVPDIRKIQVDIENDAQYNTFNLGSIINNDSNSQSAASLPRRSNRSASLEDFKQNRK